MIFDQYSRYKACSDLLRQAGFASGSTVLDIGSGTECLLGQFMQDGKMIYVDPLISSDSGVGRITGDIFTGELDNQAFDYVAAVDVLEHVPPEYRQTFLERMSSLGKNALILGFPASDASDALETDKAINEQHLAIFGRDYSWLEEHHRFGLPSLAETIKYLNDLGWHCQAVGHGHTPWLRELLGFMVCILGIPSMSRVVLEISEKFNRELYAFDFRPPHYRQFVVASRNPLLPITTPSTHGSIEAAENFFCALMVVARQQYVTESLRQLVERDAQIVDLNRKIQEVSEWATTQKEVFEWVMTQKQIIEEIQSSAVYRIAMVASRSKAAVRNKLAQSFIGDMVRLVRHRGRDRIRRVSLRAIRRSVQDNHGRLIIVFPVITWDFRWQRPQHIVSRLCEHGFSILYVAMTLTSLGRRLRNMNDAVTQIRFNELAPHINQISLNSSRPLNVYTDSIEGDDLFNITTGLKALISELLPKSVIYLVQFPGWGSVALELRSKLGGKIIFDCMDDHGGFSTNTACALKTEETLMKNADLVIASSNLLEERAKLINPCTIQVKNGTEFEHFLNPVRNGQLDQLSDRPIVGYYGAISDWFDMKIVAHCATCRPGWNFVLIGATTGADLRPVAGLNNVYFLGEKNYKDLPGYLAYFDVCTIPFKIIPLTIATNPVKFYEYLSAGKPVVSVALPELIAYQKDCYLAHNAEEFLVQLERAYNERTDKEKIERRLMLARENSWCARVSKILESQILKSCLYSVEDHE